jgi:hypothetical protein
LGVHDDDAVLDLASALGDLSAEHVGTRAFAPGRGYVKGWGVFGLPLDSGHVLALRVFPESDAGPYRSIWHRDPEGNWYLYVHGPHLNTACPRYYGAGSKSVEFASRLTDLAFCWSGGQGGGSAGEIDHLPVARFMCE